ncbi:MAG TPA: ATP-binding protein [Ktedonobacterales bacterium]|jgi:predicted kinase
MLEAPPLVIVTGPPASGKTTLGRMLAKRLRMPFLYKDGIKETLFDTLDWSDREWSRKLGVATYALLFHLLEMELAAGRSLVVESNFDAERSGPSFLVLRERYGFHPVQVCCVADGAVLLERFRSRAATNERHPGHVETPNMAEFESILLRGRLDPLPLGGSVIEVDTTEFAQVDVEAITREVLTKLGEEY